MVGRLVAPIMDTRYIVDHPMWYPIGCEQLRKCTHNAHLRAHIHVFYVMTSFAFLQLFQFCYRESEDTF